MPRHDENRLLAWYQLIRHEWLPAQGQRLGEWFQAMRAEPYLLWESTALRTGVFAVAGISGIWILSIVITAVQPPPPANSRPEAVTANFQVLCTNSRCGHSFHIERKFKFDDFPVKCPQCDQETGQRGVRCISETCKGAFVVPVERDGFLHCDQCDARLGRAR